MYIKYQIKINNLKRNIETIQLTEFKMIKNKNKMSRCKKNCVLRINFINQKSKTKIKFVQLRLV